MTLLISCNSEFSDRNVEKKAITFQKTKNKNQITFLAGTTYNMNLALLGQYVVTSSLETWYLQFGPYVFQSPAERKAVADIFPAMAVYETTTC